MLRRRMMKNGDAVHYLKSIIGTGSQYIKTNVPVTDNTVIRCSLYIENWNRNYMNLFGTGSNDSGVIRNANLDYLGFLYKGYNQQRHTIAFVPPNKADIFIDYANKIYALNNITGKFDNKDSGFSDGVMWIFAKPNAVGGNVPNVTGAFKLFSFSMTENGITILDLIPCLDDEGVPCLYDIISKTYLYNSGTGQFEYEELTE